MRPKGNPIGVTTLPFVIPTGAPQERSGGICSFFFQFSRRLLKPLRHQGQDAVLGILWVWKWGSHTHPKASHNTETETRLPVTSDSFQLSSNELIFKVYAKKGSRA